MFSATVNAYYTKWMDKTSVRSGSFNNGPHQGERYVMNLAGVDARHMGVEINATFVPTKWLEITGMLSLGNYEWASNAKGYFYTRQASLPRPTVMLPKASWLPTMQPAS